MTDAPTPEPNSGPIDEEAFKKATDFTAAAIAVRDAFEELNAALAEPNDDGQTEYQERDRGDDGSIPVRFMYSGGPRRVRDAFELVNVALEAASAIDALAVAYREGADPARRFLYAVYRTLYANHPKPRRRYEYQWMRRRPEIVGTGFVGAPEAPTTEPTA